MVLANQSHLVVEVGKGVDTPLTIIWNTQTIELYTQKFLISHLLPSCSDLALRHSVLQPSHLAMSHQSLFKFLPS